MDVRASHARRAQRARATWWLRAGALSLAASAGGLVTLGGCSEPDPTYVFVPIASPDARPGRVNPNQPQGSGAKPNRASYSRRCTTNADCVLVSFAEAACDTCKCPNDAIAVEEQRRFFDEEGAYRDTCREAPKPCQADCAPLAARREGGACTVVATGGPPARDAGAPDSAPDDAGDADAE
ncbi:MAG TPA: hypothetical protein PLR99_28500 [Polyangiaceae bacterium]|nr:hypothetical protein [Polyangiaceae bacterium]